MTSAARGREMGLGWVEAGPLVRSSYRSEEQLALHANAQVTRRGAVPAAGGGTPDGTLAHG